MNPLGVATFSVCGWECVALISRGRFPTVTALVHRHRHLPVVELAVLGVLVAGWHHFLMAGK